MGGTKVQMKVVSINVGLTREVAWRGTTVRTSIFKEPLGGRVRVDRLNVAGEARGIDAETFDLNKSPLLERPGRIVAI
jgi:hypothetical protein